MIAYLRQHAILFLSIIGIIVFSGVVILYYYSTKQEKPLDIVQVSNSIFTDEDLNKLEKTALNAALDNVFSFSNYGETTQFLYGLTENSTEKFKPKVLELINTIENNPDLYSNLTVSSTDYSVTITTQNNVQIASVSMNGILSNNSVTNQNVLIVQTLVYESPYWLLDEYQVQNK